MKRVVSRIRNPATKDQQSHESVGQNLKPTKMGSKSWSWGQKRGYKKMQPALKPLNIPTLGSIGSIRGGGGGGRRV